VVYDGKNTKDLKDSQGGFASSADDQVRHLRLSNVQCEADSLSPYATSPVVLLFGSIRKRYHVPGSMVQKLENAPDPGWAGEIWIRDVDADIGHVLIHFLHTGTYQTLNDRMAENGEPSSAEITRNEFQKAVLVLQAATTYGLPRLQELAQAEMQRQGRQMNLRSAISAIKEDLLVGSPHANAWLQDYILKKVQDVFKHTPDVFCDLAFFESIDSTSLAIILAQTVVTLFHEEMLRLRTLQSVSPSVTTKRNQGRDEGVLDDVKISVNKTPTESKKSFPSSMVSPALQSAFSASDEKDVIQSGGEVLSSKSTNTQRFPPGIPPPLFSLHTESEKGIEPASKAPPKDPFLGLSKTQRIRLEQKLKSEFAAKEKEDSEQNIAREGAPANKGHGAAETKATTGLDPEPEVKTADLFVGLSKSQKKKLEKKLKEKAARVEEKEVALAKGIAHDLAREEEQTTSAVTKEEGKAAPTNTVAEGATCSDNEQLNATLASVAGRPSGKNEDQQAFQSSLVSTETDFKDPEPFKSEYNFDSAADEVMDDVRCSLRYEHISYRAGWKECKQCELYMRKIAAKLSSIGLPDVNGL